MNNGSPSICVIICTYQREKYLFDNLKRLRECRDLFSRVIVVDNALTLDTSLSDDFIRIVHNPNLGGSGGFCRGMIEAKKEGHSHILLMDDDISFSKEAYRKAKETLLGFGKEEQEDWIGFAMRPLDRPDYQFEMGSYWNGVKMMLNNHGLDMKDPRSLERNKTHQKYNYSAWWSLIMPTSVIDRYGLPLPFFIKFDDIEYGLRRKGEAIHFDNDFYVLHEDFASKYSPQLEYYLCRNAAITNAIHFRCSLFFSLLRYHWKCLKLCLLGKPEAVRLASLGMKDYLKGPSVFIDEDIVAKHGFIRAYAQKRKNRFKEYLGCIGESFVLTFRILFLHHKAKKRWRASYPYLTSYEYWKGILGLS